MYIFSKVFIFFKNLLFSKIFIFFQNFHFFQKLSFFLNFHFFKNFIFFKDFHFFLKFSFFFQKCSFFSKFSFFSKIFFFSKFSSFSKMLSFFKKNCRKSQFCVRDFKNQSSSLQCHSYHFWSNLAPPRTTLPFVLGLSSSALKNDYYFPYHINNVVALLCLATVHQTQSINENSLPIPSFNINNP